MNEVAQNLSKLIRTINDRRVLSEGEMGELLKAIIAILAENKKGVESLNSETKQQLKEVLSYMQNEHEDVLKALQGDLTKTKAEIEKATKEQNQRAFTSLQGLIAAIKMPIDGRDGGMGERGNRIFNANTMQDAPIDALKGDIMIIEGTGELYIYE